MNLEQASFAAYISKLQIETGAVSIVPPAKSFSLYAEKAANDYNGNFLKCKDILRASLLFDTKEEMLSFLNDNSLQVVSVKNRLSKGYSDICLTIDFEGVNCELQLHLPYCLAAKDKLDIPQLKEVNNKLGVLCGFGHKLYEIERKSKFPKFWKSVGILFYQTCKLIVTL